MKGVHGESNDEAARRSHGAVPSPVTARIAIIAVVVPCFTAVPRPRTSHKTGVQPAIESM